MPWLVMTPPTWITGCMTMTTIKAEMAASPCFIVERPVVPVFWDSSFFLQVCFFRVFVLLLYFKETISTISTRFLDGIKAR
jgi:hypothetical protein